MCGGRYDIATSWHVDILYEVAAAQPSPARAAKSNPAIPPLPASLSLFLRINRPSRPNPQNHLRDDDLPLYKPCQSSTAAAARRRKSHRRHVRDWESRGAELIYLGIHTEHSFLSSPPLRVSFCFLCFRGGSPPPCPLSPGAQTDGTRPAPPRIPRDRHRPVRFGTGGSPPRWTCPPEIPPASPQYKSRPCTAP